MQWDIGIDMGTAGVRMAQHERGVQYAQSAALAYFVEEKQPFDWGDDAQQLTGRTPPAVRLRRPMMGGVLEDAQAARFWLQHLMHDVAKIRRGTALLSYAPGSRAAHEEALMRAALEAGAQEVGLVRSDVAGAIGAGLQVMAPGACFVLEIGAGHICASILTLGRIAASASLPFGFDRVREQFQRAMVTTKGFAIGEMTADEAVQALGAAESSRYAQNKELAVTGFDLKTRTPREEMMKSADVCSVIRPVMAEIAFMLEGLISQIPEELAADLIDAGLTVIGGGAQLPGLDRALGEALEIPCFIAEEPETAVARGLYEIMRRSNHFDPLVTDRMARAGRE